MTQRRKTGLRWSLLVALCFGVVLGCGAGNKEDAPLTSSHSDALRCANALTTEELVLNTLTGNRQALFLLPQVPLRSATYAKGSPFDPPLGNALHEDRARKFMSYFVSCALGPDQSPVVWNDPYDPTGHYVFRGQLGLCRQWATGPFPVSDDCKQRVSACLLARNNKEGKRVPLSLRGRDPNIFVLRPSVSTDQHQVLSTSLVASFKDCAAPVSGSGRNCGWLQDKVGTCVPGAVVTVAAGSHRPDTCSGQLIGASGSATVLRVCDGIYGCDSADPRHLGSSDPGKCPSDLGPAVEFVCRPSTSDPTVGNFSVMTGALVAGNPLSSFTRVRASGANLFPAPELAVFPYVEGAFYGNLFDGARLNDRVLNVSVDPNPPHQTINENQVIQGTIFQNMWACYARQWTAMAGYMTHRVCALPGANCAATVTGPCYFYGPAQCATDNGVGTGDFELCRDTLAVLWHNPVTTFLNQPCDVLGARDREFCQWSDRQPPPAPPPGGDDIAVSLSALSGSGNINPTPGPEPQPISASSADDGTCE